MTFTPATGYTGPASFTYTIQDTHHNFASASVSLTVNAPSTTSSLFSPSDTPATITDPDSNAVELGVKFQTSVTGNITGFRFFKGPQNTGTHTAHLWSSSGMSLASVTFTNETASGWQQVNLMTPVTLQAGTTYVVSYHSNGFYSATGNYFSTAHTSGPLTAPSSPASGATAFTLMEAPLAFQPAPSTQITNGSTSCSKRNESMHKRVKRRKGTKSNPAVRC